MGVLFFRYIPFMVNHTFGVATLITTKMVDSMNKCHSQDHRKQTIKNFLFIPSSNQSRPLWLKDRIKKALIRRWDNKKVFSLSKR